MKPFLYIIGVLALLFFILKKKGVSIASIPVLGSAQQNIWATSVNSNGGTTTVGMQPKTAQVNIVDSNLAVTENTQPIFSAALMVR